MYFYIFSSISGLLSWHGMVLHVLLQLSLAVSIFQIRCLLQPFPGSDFYAFTIPSCFMLSIVLHIGFVNVSTQYCVNSSNGSKLSEFSYLVVFISFSWSLFPSFYFSWLPLFLSCRLITIECSFNGSSVVIHFLLSENMGSSVFIQLFHV
jgi:hypothetical protein